MEKIKKQIIGYAPVDSGQLIVIDPCYLEDWKAGEVKFKDDAVVNASDNHYAATCAATTGENSGGEILIMGVGGNGVAFSTGYGDGHYPVTAEYDDNSRIIRITIDFT